MNCLWNAHFWRRRKWLIRSFPLDYCVKVFKKRGSNTFELVIKTYGLLSFFYSFFFLLATLSMFWLQQNKTIFCSHALTRDKIDSFFFSLKFSFWINILIINLKQKKKKCFIFSQFIRLWRKQKRKEICLFPFWSMNTRARKHSKTFFS